MHCWRILGRLSDSVQRRKAVRSTHTGVAQAGLSMAALALTLVAGRAWAVPSFAQQTGQPCSACHVGAFGPQLKPYGRDFKLFGYQSNDKKNHLPPIAVTNMSSFTHTQDAQQPAAAPHFAPNDNFAVDQTSIYLAGKVPAGFGVFAQTTYDGVGRKFKVDNIDVKRAFPIDVGGKDLVVGLDFNNNPTVQDAWNSSPAWTFPYNSSALAPGPAASTVLDGALQGKAVSGGAYIFWNYQIYAELSGYAPLNRVLAGRLGEGETNASDRYSGVSPYWRVAFVHDFNPNQSLEIGGYGLISQRYPGGVVSAGRDRFTDTALDANYYTVFHKNQLISAHATWIHEDQDLTASRALSGTNGHDRLDTVRGNVSWSIADTWTPTVALFHTSGAPDNALYSGQGGRPDTTGYVVELAYTGWGKPTSRVYWFNWRAALQYVGYSRFDGASQGASGNNALYLNLWLAAAPFGSFVKR